MVTTNMASLDLLAAIDLRGGRVVRLQQGDFERETAYSDDPAATAAALVGQGIKWLHVVDLDGARAGRPVHADAIVGIVEAVGGRAAVEFGGGIRDMETAARLLDAGVARVVLGTAVLRSPALAAEMVVAFGHDRVAVAVDVRAGRVVGDAWQGAGRTSDLETLMAEPWQRGVRTFEVTAIDRDGSLAGPDLELLGRVRAILPTASIIASGGIRSINDLQAVRGLGCSGAIVGRAIYEGTLSVSEALAALA
jgi:phosphoribosylformimino-5-aminoimidazole carboxamide ribotide isomerase